MNLPASTGYSAASDCPRLLSASENPRSETKGDVMDMITVKDGAYRALNRRW
jgi:hypothetical protein